jgi:hypothetical protein
MYNADDTKCWISHESQDFPSDPICPVCKSTMSADALKAPGART